MGSSSRVLVIEDDARRGAAHAALLSKHGLGTALADPSFDPKRGLGSTPPEVVVVGVAGTGGFEVCRSLRDRFDGTIVLLVGDPREQELGTSSGADDCVLRSASSFALLARIRALLGRRKGKQRIVVGKLVLDESYRRASIDGKPLALSDTEFGLLRHLAKRAGQFVAREELQNVLSGISPELASRGLEQRMSRLRTKLSRGAIRLQHSRGLGYCLEPYTSERAAE